MILGNARCNDEIHKNNPFSEGRVVKCGRMDGQTDMTRLRVVTRNFANVPRNALQIEEINANQCQCQSKQSSSCRYKEQ